MSREAAAEASRLAMMRPRQFAKPCILSALATVMSPALSVITRTPMSNSVASSVGSKETQSKVSCPNSLAPPEVGTVVKYDRSKDTELMGTKTGHFEDGVNQSGELLYSVQTPSPHSHSLSLFVYVCVCRVKA